MFPTPMPRFRSLNSKMPSEPAVEAWIIRKVGHALTGLPKSE